MRRISFDYSELGLFVLNPFNKGACDAQKDPCGPSPSACFREYRPPCSSQKPTHFGIYSQNDRFGLFSYQ